MHPHEPIQTELATFACERLERHRAQIARCVALLTPAQVWSRPKSHVNSIANLLLHLTGNVSQWILGGVGGIPIERDRPAEFAARDERPPDELMGALTAVVCDAITVIRESPPDQLLARHSIQGYDVTRQTAILHVVEHFAYHAGQIVHTTKWLADVDLSLYDAQGQRLDRTGHP